MKKSRVLSMVLVAALLTVPLAGCGNTSGGSGDEIVIGGLAPLTGSVAQYGVAVDNAVKMAVDDINAKGGLLGKRIKMCIRDRTIPGGWPGPPSWPWRKPVPMSSTSTWAVPLPKLRGTPAAVP